MNFQKAFIIYTTHSKQNWSHGIEGKPVPGTEGWFIGRPQAAGINTLH